MTRLARELERLQAARPQAARDTRTLVDDQEREALLAAITADQHHERPGPDADHRRRWLGRRAATHRRARPGVLAGSTLGLAGIGTALALVLGATTTSPAFAVTRNHDGTLTISIQRASGIAGANAKLNQLGVRAKVMQQVPASYRCTSTVVQQGQGAPAQERSSTSSSIANAHWTIDPRKIPAGQTLALTPPPAPPGADSGNSGNSGNSGQVWWSCGTEGPGPGGPPPAPPGANSGNSGNSGGGSSSSLAG